MYKCSCNNACKSFRDHVGFGPFVAGSAMPTRSDMSKHNATYKQWEADGDAYFRLAKDGYELPNLDGAAEIEKKATTKIELEHGKLYGKQATTMQRMNDGEFNE